MESNRFLLCPRYKDNGCLHNTYAFYLKIIYIIFVKIKLKFRKSVLTFGLGVKCAHTLVCIVIDGRNVSKTLTMRRKCEHRAHNAVEMWPRY